MNSNELPDDCAKQWEILLLLLSSEENKIDRTCESEVDTMNYFMRNEGVRKIMLQWLHQMKSSYAKKMSESDTALKCDKVSLLWRQKGNDKFRANLVEESYRCYSKSVLYADQSGPMYPLALANRSAALLRMKKYKECLTDVKLAIESGYPVEQQHKLFLRRADCYIELIQREESQVALKAAADHAKSLNLSEVQMMEFERHVKILERKLEALENEVAKSDDIVLPECYKGTNPNFNAASNAIDLCRSDTAGRYVVTKELTKRGDILFSEEPYAWVTLPSDDAVCEMCCQTEINPVPCMYCSRSIYCSQRCRARAAPAFHHWECVGAQSDLFPSIGIAHLALRVLLLTANEGFPPLPRPVSHPTAADVFQSYSSVDNIQIYKTDVPAFLRMFNLVTNFDKMINTDYIQYALTATMLTLYLEQFTSFFEYLPSRLPFPLADHQLRLFAAALILRGLGQLVCNGHATLTLCSYEESDGRNGRTLTEREVRRATAIYPSAAMMNHSCDPNIINTFYKNRLIIRCSRELAAGAEVSNCYGPHRARAPAAQRRAQLRAQYMFTCGCAACVDAERKDSVLVFTAYACQSCKGPVLFSGRRARCQQCPAEFQLQRALAAIDRADDLLQQAERASSLEERCERVHAAFKLKQQVWHRHHCSLRAAADKLARLYADLAERASSLEERCERVHAAFKLKQQVWHRHHCSLRAAADKLARLYADLGEFSKSVELIKQNIQSLEYQYGSFSVEVAHEMRKLSDVMLERIINSPQNPDYRDWCLEAHKIIKKAVQLMELNYGSWEPLVKRLKEHEALVAATLADSRAPEAADCVHHNLHYNLKI